MYDTAALLREMDMEDNGIPAGGMNMDDTMITDGFDLEPKTKTRTVLIAEDEELIRRSVSRIISGNGYEVVEAENGAIALEKLRENPPDLILTDLRMPEMDGFELLEAVSTEAPHIPVIIFSGVGTKPDIISALRMGAWDYIMKPVQDVDYLVDTIEKVMVQAEMNHGYSDLMEKALRNKNEELEKELQERKILENQLLHAKKEWEKTVDSITEAIALLDKNSMLIRVNKAMADMLGAHPAKIVGKEHYLSTDGFNNKQQAIADHTAILRGNHLRGKFTSEDGNSVYEVTISPYYDHDDRVVIGAVYVARNISER